VIEHILDLGYYPSKQSDLVVDELVYKPDIQHTLFFICDHMTDKLKDLVKQ